MTLTKEVSETDLNGRLKDMFQTKEEFSSIIQSNDGDINALFSTLKEFIK